MGITANILDDILAEVAPNRETIDEVRARRDEILHIAGAYPGALRTYRAGSVEHKTPNSDTDADCGVVLDRRSYPDLAPDGDNQGPSAIVEDMRTYVRDELKQLSAEIRSMMKPSGGRQT